jgi:hypothetical protein
MHFYFTFNYCSEKHARIEMGAHLFVSTTVTLMVAIKKYKLQTFCHYFCYINACYKKMSQKAWKFQCQLPVHLFDKSNTFAERKEKTVQSRSRLTTDNFFSRF